MIRMKFSQVTVGDVVMGDDGHTVEVKYIEHADDGRIVLREQVVYELGNKVFGWPNDDIEVTNRCEVCRQRTLAHTGECMSPVCQNISEVPDDPEAQLAWVAAARAFKSAASKMSELWCDLDERAQCVETPDEYPFDKSFDEGPMDGIHAWLNEEKLIAIERRASIMGDCPNCGGPVIRRMPPTEVSLSHRGADAGVDGQLIATCDDCHVSIIK